MYSNKFRPSWNLIFWTTHFISWTGLILPLFLMTPMIEGFTFGVFHNTVSILEFVIVFFTLGGFRSILNCYVDWRDINFLVVLKIIVFTIIGGITLQLAIYYSLHITISSFFPSRSIPNMYLGGEELRFIDTILKISSWVFGFFTIKMIINYNSSKLEEVVLLDKVKQEEINIISGRIDADFMANSIELTKNLVLTDVNKARETLTQLSNVLRYNLTQESVKDVTIQEELDVIGDYLDLIRGNCSNNIIYETTISEKLLNVLITPMKFKNVIKKMISCNTISVNIIVEAIEDSYLVKIETINKKAEEFIKQSLSENLKALFSEDEKFEFHIVGNEFNSCFKVSSATQQSIDSYE